MKISASNTPFFATSLVMTSLLATSVIALQCLSLDGFGQGALFAVTGFSTLIICLMITKVCSRKKETHSNRQAPVKKKIYSGQTQSKSKACEILPVTPLALATKSSVSLSETTHAERLAIWKQTLKDLSQAASRFIISFLKASKKKKVSDLEKEEIDKMLNKIREGAIDNFSLIDQWYTKPESVNFRMPIFAEVDVWSLFKVTQQFSVTSVVVRQALIDIDYKYGISFLAAKINLSSKILTYVDELHTVANDLYLAGHRGDAFEKDYALLTHKKQEIRTFFGTVQDRISSCKFHELAQFLQTLPALQNLEKRWNLDSSVYKKYKKNEKIQKIPKIVAQLAKKAKAIEGKSDSYFNFATVLDPDLYSLIPKMGVKIDKNEALELIVHHIIPVFREFIAGESLFDQMKGLSDLIQLMQSLSVTQLNTLKEYEFDLYRSSLCNFRDFEWIKNLDQKRNMPGFWFLVDGLMILPSVQEIIRQLPFTLQILVKPLLQMMQPGKFRDKMVPILSNFDSFLAQLEKERKKDFFDVNAILQSLTSQINTWSESVEALN